MSPKPKDPTAPIRDKASKYPDVEVGTACNQTAYKVNKKAFLYIGPQADRFKAMFRLSEAIPEAEALAKKSPDMIQVGKPPWVTARFSAADPMPKSVWVRWLEESYQLSLPKAKSGAKRKKAV